MNLTITQDNTRTETINSSIIDKLYEIAFAASSDPNSTVSLTGRLESPKGYKYKIDWLNTNFSPDLTISTTIGLYMTFYDSNLQNVLKNTIGDGEGVLLNEFLAITNDSQLGLGSNATAHPEITDFREGCLLTGLTSLSTGFAALSGITIFGFPPNVVNYPGGSFASNIKFDGVVVKNINNFINRAEVNLWWTNGYYLYDMDNNGNLTRIDTLTLPSAVSFPNGVNKDCLCGVKLEELIIPSSCTYITSLSGPYLKKISFESPSSLTTIEANTFWYGPSWTNSTVLLNVANLPLTITTIGSHAFRSCSNVTGVLDLHNLTSLGQYSFYSTGITSIADLGSITSVSGMCFNNCDSLTTVTLPNSCTSIDDGAFAFCDALTSIDLGGVATIANLAFIADPALTTVTGTSNLTSIGNNAFLNCNLSGALTLPNLTSLGSNSFAGCTSLSSIDFTGSRFTSVPLNAFQGCTSLTSVTLSSTCKTIAGQAFDGCTTLTSINLDNIESISAFYAFRNTGITDYVLPNIKNLGARNLSGCHNAYLLDCGSNLTTIASDALWDSGFSVFIFRGTTPPSFSGSNFEYNMTGRIIYVPDAAVTDYQTAWPNMASYITGLSNYNPS